MHPTPPGGLPAETEKVPVGGGSGASGSEDLDTLLADMGWEDTVASGHQVHEHPEAGTFPADEIPGGAARPRELSLHEQMLLHEEQGDLQQAPVDSSKLDDLMSKISGDQPIDPEHEHLQALVDAIGSGATIDRGAVPTGGHRPPVMPAVALGLFELYSPDQVSGAVTDIIDCGILQHIIAHGGLGLAAHQLGPVVKSIRKRYLQGDRPDEPYNEIVKAMVADQPCLAELGQLVNDKTLAIPLPHAAAILCFRNTYPAFWPCLKEKAGIKFNSHLPDDRGGGLFDPRTCMIYMSHLIYTPPGAFIRLLVHEMGHATFEVVLLGGQPIPIVLEEYRVADLKGDPLKPGPEIQKLHSYWDDMPVLAKTFYHAWLTLRLADGCHLLGLDLWRDPDENRLSPDQRQRYQAKSFSEFCAETFMLFAMGDLHPHVVAILSDRDIDPNVKIAWKNAWAVLVEVALPMLGS